MPFPNEHAARQVDPGEFSEFRRTHLSGFPKGIDAIIGIKASGKTAIQSLRFDRKLWTPNQSKKWLKDHGFKTTLEEATPVQKDTHNMWSGILRL